ncbi:MAG: hypothetical protein KJZ75_09875 [Hyphomonadaceae bacterium]|nr:hypothetical protein [Hyphomonadaceae bacterium]
MTAKRSSGAQAAPDKTPFLFAVMPNPAMQSFVASQRVALEAARFWARRMHAYADQMETLACCTNPDDFAKAQTHFFDRMREDYAAETKAMSTILAAPRPEQDEDARRP